MKMKALVNQELCVGCGLCVSMNPEVFLIEDNGLAKAVNETDDESLLQDCIDSCPVSAISKEGE